MKKINILALCIFSILIISCSSSKDTVTEQVETQVTTVENESNPEVEGRRGRRGSGPGGNAERRTAMIDEMIAQLDLSEEQEVQFKEINDRYRAKMRSLFEESDGDRMAMREPMRALRAQQAEEVKGILSEAQFTKYEEINKNRRGRRGGMRGSRGGR